MRQIVALLMALAALSICLSAYAYPHSYLYRYPEPTVIIGSSVSPEVLMPGDTGIVKIEIENCADDYVVSYQREDYSLSVPIHSAELHGTGGVEVISDAYEDVGNIGPGDTIIVYYAIKADENITDGTHFIDFKLVGGYEEDPDEINRKIPVKIDSSDVMLIQAEAPTGSGVSLDVANPRQNTLNAVTVVPEARGVEFSPEEYYIGTMEPDEIFTIDFDLKALAPADATDLGFKSRFKNGDTWHESEVYTITATVGMESPGNARGPPGEREDSGMGTTTTAAAILLPVIIGGAYFWCRRTRRP